MPIVILLLVLLVLGMCFGPVIGAVATLITTLGVVSWLLLAFLIPAFCACALFLLGLVIWVVMFIRNPRQWWAEQKEFDRMAAAARRRRR